MCWEFHFLRNDLFSETDFFDQLAVVLQVAITQVGQQAFSFADKLHQPAMCGKILLIGLKMVGYSVDTLGQQGNLSFNGSGICGTGPELCEVFCCFFFSQIRHLNFFNASI